VIEYSENKYQIRTWARLIKVGGELTPFKVLLDGHVLLFVLDIEFESPGGQVMRSFDRLPAVEMNCPHSDTSNECGSSGPKARTEEFPHGLGEVPWLIESSRTDYVKLN
jgi:hypothetical protein